VPNALFDLWKNENEAYAYHWANTISLHNRPVSSGTTVKYSIWEVVEGGIDKPPLLEKSTTIQPVRSMKDFPQVLTGEGKI